MVSAVLLSFIVYAFLSVSYGYLNTTVFADSPKNWYATARFWPVILTIVHLWQNAGQSSIVYMASIGGIDKSDAPVISSAKRGDAIIQAVNYRLEGILTGSHQFDEVRKLRVTITIDGGSDSMVKTYTLTL
jgi:hypothetical protein